MIKKILVCVLALSMMSGSLIGCSSSSKTVGSSTEGSKTSSTKEFDWKQSAGTEINVLMMTTAYTDDARKRLPEFEKKTGIKVNLVDYPEAQYFDKVTTQLNSKSTDMDGFLTGPYAIWEYASTGYLEDLDPFINDKSKTSSDYDLNDFIPGVIKAARWDLTPGDALGTGKLWGVPFNFEQYALTYNKRALEKAGLKVPKTLDDLVAAAKKLDGWNGPGSYGVAVRGARSWGTIHPGFMTTYSNAGAKDFAVENGKLVAKFDSPESIDVTKKFADMIKNGGPKDWSNYTWYMVSADIGAGKAAIMFDADYLGYLNNLPGGSKEAGNLAFAPAPEVRPGQPVGSNEWAFTYSMNKASTKKDATWLFMQYFTGKEHLNWSAIEGSGVNPVRQSIWKDPKFIEKMKIAPGYIEAFNAMTDNTSVKFTPQPEFFNTTTEWSGALQEIVAGANVEERLKKLTVDVNKVVSKIRTK